MRPLTEAGFWAKVDRSGGADACWPWTASLLSTGYGRVVVRGHNVRAHRMAFEFTHGTIAPGLVIRHSCDNRPCCNPTHLLSGTVGDNNRDTAARGRLWVQSEAARLSRLGERNPRARLTTALVLEARHLARTGLRPSEIARKIGVDHGTIDSVLRGKTWRHV